MYAATGMDRGELNLRVCTGTAVHAAVWYFLPGNLSPQRSARICGYVVKGLPCWTKVGSGH